MMLKQMMSMLVEAGGASSMKWALNVDGDSKSIQGKCQYLKMNVKASVTTTKAMQCCKPMSMLGAWQQQQLAKQG